jgi:hypothetical protein
MPNQARRQMVADRDDAEQIVHLAFEASGRERHVGEARDGRGVDRKPHLQLDSIVGSTGDHHVHDPDRVAALLDVVMRGDERQPMTAAEQLDELTAQIVR